MSCSSYDCKKFSTCKKAIVNAKDNEVWSAVPWASYGSGGSDIQPYYHCGEAGKYKLYEQVEHPQKITNNDKFNRMTVEEKAKFLVELTYYQEYASAMGSYFNLLTRSDTCDKEKAIQDTITWLNSEVED